jgi:hypothetical protein
MHTASRNAQGGVIRITRCQPTAEATTSAGWRAMQLHHIQLGTIAACGPHSGSRCMDMPDCKEAQCPFHSTAGLQGTPLRNHQTPRRIMMHTPRGRPQRSLNTGQLPVPEIPWHRGACLGPALIQGPPRCAEKQRALCPGITRELGAPCVPASSAQTEQCNSSPGITKWSTRDTGLLHHQGSNPFPAAHRGLHAERPSTSSCYAELAAWAHSVWSSDDPGGEWRTTLWPSHATNQYASVIPHTATQESCKHASASSEAPGPAAGASCRTATRAPASTTACICHQAEARQRTAPPADLGVRAARGCRRAWLCITLQLLALMGDGMQQV